MILHSLEVSDFTCFHAPFRVSLDPRSVNLLCGPNGSGKSSLLSALTLAFTASHKSAGADIRAVQPRGRSLAPRVVVDFSHDNTRFRLTKSFLLKSRSALLERWDGGAFSPLARDEAVEAELPRFLGGAAGAGESARTRQAWLASILWSRQNEIALQPVAAEVRDMVRQILTAQSSSSLTALIAREAQRAYDLDFTPGGKPKKSSEAVRLLAEATAAREQADRRQAELEDLELLRQSVANLESEQSTLRTQSEDLTTRFQDLDAALTACRQTLATRTELTLKIDAREQEAGQIRLLSDRLAAGRSAVTAARRQLDDLEPRLATAREAAAQAAALHREATTRNATEAGSLQAQLDAVAAPSPSSLASFEALHQELLLARARLDSALLHIDITPLAGATITISAGESPGPLHLTPGATQRVSGSPEIVIDIPGFGAIRASGPAESATAIRDTIARASARWDTLAAPFSGASIEELRSRRAQAAGLETRLAAVRASLERDTAGLTPEALADRDAAARLHALERERQLAADALQSASTSLARLEADCPPEDASRARLSSLALELLGLREQLLSVETALAANPPGLEARHAAVRADLDRVLVQQSQVRDLLTGARSRLEEKLSGAPYHSFAAARARLAETEDAWRQAQLSADAAKLLHETLSAVRAEAESRIIPPLESGANDILHAISGALPGDLRLDEQLVPHALAAPGLASGIDVGQLSGGEFEQVHFAARLALADLFCLQSPQPVVFDDALLATDATRLARILDLLQSRAGRMQVLILTCHPERYSALQGAHTVQLPSLQAARA